MLAGGGGDVIAFVAKGFFENVESGVGWLHNVVQNIPIPRMIHVRHRREDRRNRVEAGGVVGKAIEECLRNRA